MEEIIDFIILILIYYFIFYKKWIKKSKKEFVINTLMYMYISLVLYVTIMPFRIPLPIFESNNLFLETANFTPFIDITKHHKGALQGIFLNTIMTIPFSFLLMTIKKRKFITVILFTFLFSLGIETWQLLSVWSGGGTSRIFDVTDLITNTVGGIIGYYIYLIFSPIINMILSGIKD